MPSGGQNRIPDVDLLAELRRVDGELEHPVRQTDIRQRGRFSVGAYYRAFGSWNGAKEAAGSDLNRPTVADRIVVECDNCGEEFEKRTSQLEHSEFHYCSRPCFHEHYSERKKRPVEVVCGTCGAVVEKTRWEVEQNDRLFCSKDCSSEAMRSSVKLVCDHCGDEFSAKPSVADERRFCSRECMGQWRSENVVGEAHPRWSGGYEPYYGPNWPIKRRRALRRDQRRCQDCGITEPEHLDRHGEELSVHHIQPFRSFVDSGTVNFESANRLANLVTLCRRCHARYDW